MDSDPKEDRCGEAGCGQPLPASESVCPHCGRPSLFPNVRAVSRQDERTALEDRYQKARLGAAGRGAEHVVGEFESAVARSEAVLARSATEVHRLATNEKAIYATYYQRIEGGARLPDGDKWDVLRSLADDVLFPGYRKNVRFAALTLDGVGLYHYGECSMTLRTEMIAHRATLLEENSAVFMQRPGVTFANAAASPRGYRSSWADRAKLCVAKLAAKLQIGTAPREFPGLLLRQGKTPEDDDFVEVHIFGPLTIRTVARVIYMPKENSREAWGVLLDAAMRKLDDEHKVEFEERRCTQ